MQKTNLASPCSNLRSFGRKCTVFNKKLVTLLGLFSTLQSFSAWGIVPTSLFLWCDISRQMHSCEIHKNPECLGSLVKIDRSQLFSFGHVSGSLTKDWRGKFSCLNPRESGPDVLQIPGGVTASPNLLGLVPSWCGSSRMIRDCC